MGHARMPVPHAAEFVLVQFAFGIEIGVHRPAARRQIKLFDFARPGIVIEVGADLDDMIADEIRYFLAILQAIVLPIEW